MKRIVSFIAILFCCSIMMAQQVTPKNKQTSNANKRVLFGASAGPTVDWFAPTSDSLYRANAKAGIITGLNLDVNLTKGKSLYFSTGVLFRYLQGDLAFYYVHNFFGKVPIERTYQTMYLSIPTGVTFRISATKECILIGKLGLYHNFNLSGNRFDNFNYPGETPEKPYYFITTIKEKNNHAALFAESAYAGLGFEYMFKKNLRVFSNLDYSCQFNYFNSIAISNLEGAARFKTKIHSLHVVFGLMF